MRRLAIKTLAIAGMALGVLIFAPVSAHALTATQYSGCFLGNVCRGTVTDNNNELNTITVTLNGSGDYVFTDTSATTVSVSTGQSDCTVSDPAPAPVAITCDDSALDHVNNFTINLADGNDTINASAITGGDPNWIFNGGNGNDTIIGQNDVNTLNGDAGNDTLQGRDEPDAFNGGTGIDRVSYEYQTLVVTADTDGVADDGSAGGADCNTILCSAPTDNVALDIEAITGGTNNDTLTGHASNNDALTGVAGNDTLNGQGGNDFIAGGAGADTINGGAGTDRASYTPASQGAASSGANITLNNTANDSDGLGATTENVQTTIEYLFGTNLGDVLNASANGGVAVALWGRDGADTLTGSSVDDFLDGQVGADTLDCGGGANDMFYSDTGQPGGDVSVTACETPATTPPKETP